jgi:hypothetical protein
MKRKDKALDKMRILDKRSPWKYSVIIRNGEDWRLFSDFTLMCDLMGLDPVILSRHFESRGYYTGFEFTVFRVQEETSTRNRGLH